MSADRKALQGGGRRWLAVMLAIVLAGGLTGAVVAGQFDDGSDLVAAIDDVPLQRVADVSAVDGIAEKGVFVGSTRTGHLCVWEASSATSRDRSGGCNTADDPLNGRPLWFTLGYDGGPDIASVKTASLFGLAAPVVAQASVLMSDGTERDLKLKRANVGADKFRAFGFRFKKSDLRKGIGPTAVIARDVSGAEIARQPTGIG
jgi:hypothetical protein